MEPSSAYVSDFMSFVVKKLPPAEQDALEAAIWYEERQPGLGEEFLSEIDRAVRALGETALLHRVRFADVRRAPVLFASPLICGLLKRQRTFLSMSPLLIKIS